jgi:exopolyphosphatase / guanosine-5'-triphosphate,3'-diphosphate pyrophosphatase
VANPSRIQVPALFSGSNNPAMIKGRLASNAPLAVVDIGSNSVRLVAYEGLTRAPTPLFNEKVLCGLGKGVANTGFLPEEGVALALKSLQRFRALITMMQISEVHVIATAAARDAKNGPEFLAAAEEAIGAPVQLLSGKREATLSAHGIRAGFFRPDGLVGDLGGGSLELIDVSPKHEGGAVSLPLGGLALTDSSGGSLKKAAKIVDKALKKCDFDAKRRSFYAVGGTWRALAKLHMAQKGYALNVLHHYRMDSAEAIEFCRMVQRLDPDALPAISSVSTARRPLLALGALVLEHTLLHSGARDVAFSALGVREGLLFDLLSKEERERDPLLAAAMDFNILRSRAPQHGLDLIEWTDRLFDVLGLEETDEERRLRAAACLLADIGWRAHPDFRGEQTLHMISNAAIVGIDHPGRAYIALAVFYRHNGISEADLSPRLRELTSTRLQERARILGAAMRVAYIASASMPGVLPRIGVCRVSKSKLGLVLPQDLAPLTGDRLQGRLRQLAKLSGQEAEIQYAT